MSPMRVTYDPESDKAHIELADPMPRYGLSSDVLREDRFGIGLVLEFDSKSRLIGIELRGVTRNVHPDVLDAADIAKPPRGAA